MIGPSFGISPEQMHLNALSLAGVQNQPGLASAAASRYGSDQQLKAMQLQTDAARYQTDKDLAGLRYGADSKERSEALGSSNLLAGQKYGADQSLAGSRYGQDAETARMQKMIDLQNSRFNQLFPYFQSEFSGLSGGGAGGYGGVAPAAPPIPLPAGGGGRYGYGGGSGGGGAPVYSEGQIQQQVNSAIGRNDARTAGQERRATQDLAGRGLGATSPLAMALRAMAQGAGLKAGTDLDRETRMAAAQANADDRLARYQTGAQTSAARFSADRSAAASEYGSQVAAQASQYGQNLDYRARLAAVEGQRQNALLSALASMMGNFG
jgi:hypothetical protein